MLTVYTENGFEIGPEWNNPLKGEYITWEEYGFTFRNINSIEKLTPRQIYALYGFITDEDCDYMVLTTDNNHRIYVMYDKRNIFMSYAG